MWNAVKCPHYFNLAKTEKNRQSVRWKYVSIQMLEGNLGVVIIPCGQWFFIFTSPAGG